MRYFDHPLNNLSKNTEYLPQDNFDHTPPNFEEIFATSIKSHIKKIVGSSLYPIKNALEYKKSLKGIGLSKRSFNDSFRQPDTITLGQKGAGKEIFFRTISKRVCNTKTIIHFGCGLGNELLLSAKYLNPSHIIGCDFFNYEKAWNLVKKKIQSKNNIKVDFFQVDLRTPVPIDIPKGDLLISISVLEHLIKMDTSLQRLKDFLKPGGNFASIWGPMWYSFSGDHIAAELGLQHGFDHLLLTPEKYFEFYKSHPRNVATFANNERSWLELGLCNFATYDEYLNCMRTYFGDPKYLLWTLSQEGLVFKKKYPEKWKKILAMNNFLSERDLILSCASIII